MAEIRYQIADAGTVLALRAQARRIREALQAVTEPGDTIVLDFAGVDAITNAFAHELLADIPDRKVVIRNENEHVREALTTALTRRGLPAHTHHRKELTMSEEPSGTQILDTPMPPNDADAATIRDYLIALLTLVWDHGEGFNGKRPFGNSGWAWELYAALAKAGHIEATFDVDGYLDDVDDEKGRKLISQAIRALGTTTEGSDR